MVPSDFDRDLTLDEAGEPSRWLSFKRAVITWGIWRSVLSLWGFTIWRLGLVHPAVGREWLYGFTPATEGIRAGLIDIWLRWDTVHYLRIIQFGYGPDERSAFFPLYPLLGKVFGVLTGGDHLLALLLVSNLAVIGCFYSLDKLVQIGGRHSSQNPIRNNLVYHPAGFFLLVAYPQSLVLFFSLAAYLAQRRQRLLITFLLGFAAGLTHSTALPLAFLLIVDALSAERKRKLKLLVALGPILGIACFLAWRSFAGLPSYQEVQWAMSGRSIGFSIDFAGLMSPWTWLVRGWPNLLALLMGIGAVRWAYRSQYIGLVWFQIVLLLIPIVSAPGFEPLDGLARYTLVGFPLYLALSEWVPQGWKRLGLLGVAIGANMYMSGLFILWGFVG